MNRISRLAVSLAVLGLALPLFAQAPAWSRGEQNLPISYDECYARAGNALQAEGYNITNRGGAFIGGNKDVHAAVIMCNVAPNNRTWANIVVASVSSDSGVPGLERQRLQARMDRPAAPPSAGNGATACGTWRWFNGNVVTIRPDGTQSDNHGGSGTWRVENDGRVHLHWPTYNSDDYLTVSADGNSVIGTYNGQAATSNRTGGCSAGSAPPPPPPANNGAAACGVWTWFNGNVVTIRPDGTQSDDHGGSGTWRVESDGRAHLHWPTYNSDDYVSVSPDGNTLRGTYNGQTANSSRRGACPR